MELDDKLYDDYFNGDKEAFNLLYSKYKEKIKYFIYNIVHDYQKAEDLTQETFIYVMQNKMKESCSFKYYIYLKARSLAISFLNVENRRNEIRELYLLNDNEPNEKDVLECILNEENKKELIESINCLDEKYKNAIYLTKIEGLSYLETSKILGKSIQNTQTLVHRGKIQLRKILIKRGFDEMNKVAKVLIIMLIATTIISGVVYALTNVKISGRPAIEWFKVNFSDEYENYREEVQGEIIQAPSESSIELVSTVCDEGFVILEFNLKLSKEDKKYLKIGEPILTEEYINSTDDEDSKTIYSYDFDYENRVAIPKQTVKEHNIEEYSDKKIEDSLYVGYNCKPGFYEDDFLSQRRCYWFVIIDGEYYSIRFKPQTITQVSEYEYKIYQMYFLTDEELGDKTEFTITIKDWVISTKQTQLHDNDTCLKINGQFDIQLSKERALENSKRIELNCDDIIYPKFDLTQKIESVIVTPLQTIVKVHSTYKNLSTSNKSNLYGYLGLKEYKVMSENGEEINSFNFEAKRTITYADGEEATLTRLEYEEARFSFENATLETTDYILIENHKENSKIKIITQEGHENVEPIDMGSFEIDLTKEQK